MSQVTYKKLKQTYDAIIATLNDQESNLTKDEREDLEAKSTEIAEILKNSWFPQDWVRRIIMLVIFNVGLLGLLQGNYYLLLLWLLLPIFSPRVLTNIGSKNTAK